MDFTVMSISTIAFWPCLTLARGIALGKISRPLGYCTVAPASFALITCHSDGKNLEFFKRRRVSHGSSNYGYTYDKTGVSFTK